MSAPDAVFRVLVRAFPRGHRKQFGEEMARAFGEGHRRIREQRGRAAAATWVVRAWVDVLRAGSGERLRGLAWGWLWGSRRPPRPPHRPLSPEPGRAAAGFWDGLGLDLRYALRVLARSPLFTVSAVVVLGLGIGANTAVFGALRAALLSPPPYPDAGRLAFSRLTVTREAAAAGQPGTIAADSLTTMAWSWAKFRMLREGLADIADVAGYASRTLTLKAPGEAEPVGVELVTPAYLSVLGIPLLMGRGFEAGDENPGGEPVALLAHDLWVDRFGADPDVLGRTIRLNETAFTVIGVLPTGFGGVTGSARAVLPMGAVGELYQPWMLAEPQAHWIHAILRLGPPVDLSDAESAVRRLGAEIEAAYPLADPGETVGARLQPLADVRQNAGARRSALALTAAAALVLLIAVANLAALLLARAGARVREGAVRLAVGAGRWRLARGLLVESLVLALMGGAAGVGVAAWGTSALRAAWPLAFLGSEHDEIRAVNLDALALDGPALAFALCVAVSAGILFGVLPALRAHGTAQMATLRTGGALAGAGSRAAGGARTLLVSVQSALALVLVVGAGLLLSTLSELQSVERGFDPDGLLVFDYDARRGDVAAADPEAFQRELLERLRALPGVRAATAASSAPLSGHTMTTFVSEAEGRAPYPQGQGPRLGIHIVEETYFATLGATLLRGRLLERGDEAGPRVVINETAARELFPDLDPIGRSLDAGYHVYDAHDGTVEVVGVVADLLHGRPDEERISEAYYPANGGGPNAGTVLLRTDADPMELFPQVRDVARAMDPGLPLTGITTGGDLVTGAVADTRVVVTLLGLFAALALVLAATGVYAVVAYAVLHRRRELGLRLALGARRDQVVGMVLRQGMAAGTAGVAVGVVVAFGATRYLEGLLFQVSATDPLPYVAAAAVLMTAMFVASWLPARRVTRMDPTEVLRSE